MKRPVTDPFTVEGIILVSVKDYDVDECIKNKEQFDISVGDEVMSLTWEELKSKEIMRSNQIKSKTGGRDYCLVSYRWIPNKKDND